MQDITKEELQNFFAEYGADLTMEAEAQLEKYYRIRKAKPETSNEYDEGFTWSDGGLSRLFAVVYKNEALYCIEHKCWYVFQDGKWQQDIGALYIAEKMLEFSLLMRFYADNDVGDFVRENSKGKAESFREAYIAFVSKIEGHQMRERILQDARALMKCHVDVFDTNARILNIKGGTYVYDTSNIITPEWELYCSKQTRFTLEKTSKVDLTTGRREFKHAKCEKWEKFMREVCEDDVEKIDFLQRALGYSVFGDGREECMFILHGLTTRNGKSTMLNTITHLLGDYARVVPVGLICKQNNGTSAESASPVLASLRGVRFISMAESNAYGSLDEEQIKQLTGGEEISARALYQSAFTYRPQFVMWLSCNDLPTVTDKSLFASQRIHVIDFNHHFTQEEQDKNLKHDLTAPDVMQGIFLWLVKGFKKYEERGLEKPKRLQHETDDYEKENDTVLLFLEEKCEKAQDSETKIQAKDLYQSYKSWARSQGAEIYSARKFGAEMKRHSEWYASIRKPQNKIMYCGMTWKDNL